MTHLRFISPLVSFLIMILLCCLGNAQTAETIGSARPGQSIGPNVVGTGLLQIQSGFQFDSQSGVGSPESNNFNNVIRYGLNESFELSAVVNHRSQKFKNSTNRNDGINNLQVGFRYNLRAKPEGWLPSIGLQTRFQLTSIGNDYKPQAVAPITVLAIRFKLCDSLVLTSNGIIRYNGNDAIPTHQFTAALGYQIHEKLETFFEVYGNERSGVDRHYIDWGFGYFIGNDWKLDASMGWGENFGETETFVSLGFSTRFRTLGNQ